MAPRLFILTGSGVSAESGIATFRDANGVWAKYDYREVATPEGFAANPALVHEFYNARRRGVRAAQPNAAHRALADLERALDAEGGRLTLVTQNVDDLHERAGSRRVIHMHGEILMSLCGECGDVSPAPDTLSVDDACERCGRAGALRPDVVWFGEFPKFLDEIADALVASSDFLSIGTSGSVYPAAGFVMQACDLGIPCTEINLEPSDNRRFFAEGLYGEAGALAPDWCARYLADVKARH